MKFLGCEDVVDFFVFWMSYLGHFYAFYGLILGLKYRMGMFFGVAKISILLGVCLIFFFFFGKQ